MLRRGAVQVMFIASKACFMSSTYDRCLESTAHLADSVVMSWSILAEYTKGLRSFNVEI